MIAQKNSADKIDSLFTRREQVPSNIKEVPGFPNTSSRLLFKFDYE